MIHLIVGIVTVVLGAWGITTWWRDFGEVLRGLIPLLLVLGGLAAIGAGFQKTLRETENENVETPSATKHVHPEGE
ncbi:MAG: hypothetical protein ACYS8W_13455 [Planctomycetota bacterium]|jgi:hypothetical protein